MRAIRHRRGVKLLVLCCPGILAKSQITKEWHHRMAAYYDGFGDGVAGDDYDYRAFPLTAHMFNKSHARELAYVTDLYPDAKIVGVGHSNAARLWPIAIKNINRSIDSLILVAPACHEDIAKSGYLATLLRSDIKRLVVCWSRGDTVLKGVSAKGIKGWLSRNIAKYGAMGYKGPRGYQGLPAGSVSSIEYASVDHSEYWQGQMWVRMQQIINKEVTRVLNG